MDKDEETVLSRLVRIADKTINLIAFILFLVILLYAGHAIWYTNSLVNGSFLPDELAKFRPDGEEPTLSDLVKERPDVISWITINDTSIDYPVVQGEDDTEYLNKDVMGEQSLAGSIFLTIQNKKDFSDPYNVLYGHNIEGGAMFADVLEFRKASFFEKHKYGTLWYPDDEKSKADRIEIFAVVEIGADDERIYCDPGSVKPKDLPGLVRYIRKVSTQDRGIRISKKERIVAMSTCENAASFGRVILFGKLRPMTEAEIKAAMKKEKSKEKGQKGGLLNAVKGAVPWILTAAGALLILLLLYILWRKERERKEKKKLEKEKRQDE